MTNPPPSLDSIRVLARDRFGFTALTPGQESAIEAVLSGSDTLCVLPTGSGKSAIYQLTGIAKNHLTVVVSPLIALQQDQVESINEIAPGSAVEINSTLSQSEREEAIAHLRSGAAIFVFLAPEQLANADILDLLIELAPALFVVDEAHCISEWGQDFRPDYLKLGAVIDALQHPPVLALTATASPPVRNEIVERLHMIAPAIVVRGFDRPNIHLAVEPFSDEDEKFEALIDGVANCDGAGIIYAATRKSTETIASALTERGISAAAYHAGLHAAEREQIQVSFMDDQVRVIVATTAFGMGIDKANVRFVYHHDISDSIDSYYQEIGRAGRDGDPAEAVLFYRPEDIHLRRFQSGAGQLDIDDVTMVVEQMLSATGPMDAATLHHTIDLTETVLTRALNRLEDVHAISIAADGTIALVNRSIDVDELALAAVDEQRNRQQYAQSKLEMIRQYAEADRCRRGFILEYFGEAAAPSCGACDVCDRNRSARVDAEPPTVNRPFPASTRVLHTVFGPGVVTHAEDDSLIVLFDDRGYRTLSLELVTAEGLLRRDEGDPVTAR